MAFVDTDGGVVARFDGRDIADIWSQEGESAFRETEARVVAEAVSTAGRVVALGGGAVTEHPDGRAAVERADALRVYLAAPADVLARRIAGDADTQAARPSLTGISSVTGEIASVLARRDPVYRAVADAVVDVSALGPSAIVERVAALAGDD